METCPVCKSDKYLDQSLKLLVSPCYHRVCDSCVQRLFSYGSAPCPVCGTTLRRSNFVNPVYEDLEVEREVRIRRQLGAIFNRQESDFDSLHAYNDYLEEVEEIVFNLVNDVDIQRTNARLEEYRVQYRDLISRNAGLASRQARLAKQQREAEEQQRLNYEQQILQEIETADRDLESQRESFIDMLAQNHHTIQFDQAQIKRSKPDVSKMMDSNFSKRMQKEKALYDPFETIKPAVKCPIFSNYEAQLMLCGEICEDSVNDVMAAGGLSVRQILISSMMVYCSSGIFST